MARNGSKEIFRNFSKFLGISYTNKSLTRKMFYFTIPRISTEKGQFWSFENFCAYFTFIVCELCCSFADAFRSATLNDTPLVIYDHPLYVHTYIHRMNCRFCPSIFTVNI